MTHIIASTILSLGMISPLFFAIMAINMRCEEDAEKTRGLFSTWLAYVAGVALTSALSFLFYCSV